MDLGVWPLVLIGAARFLTRPLFNLATRWGQRINMPALTRVWNGADWAASVIFAVLFFGFFYSFVTLRAFIRRPFEWKGTEIRP